MKQNIYFTLVSLLLFFWITFSLKATPLTTEDCPTPINDHDWQISNSMDLEFDKKKFCHLVRDMGSEESELHSFVIERHGKLVTEVYNTRKDKPFNKRYGLRFPFDGETTFDSNTLHDVRSVSKSVTSLLFGIAIDKKIIDGLDSSVLSYYPELSISYDDPRQKITWKHLLTMSSGLDWEEWRYGFYSATKLGSSGKRILLILF
ncbi:serine hydrolase [Leptospira wolbachii]|uniref:serine hydrolase n=1 Tax=Leptospira wolbachii TaxID=29511 RepID=UPI0022B57C92|nr:serine hydrolase [Leptospira wolbachii]